MLTENGTFRCTNRILRVASIVRQPQHIVAHSISKAAAAAVVAVAVAVAAAGAAAASAAAHDTAACVSLTTRVSESLCWMQRLYKQQQQSYCGRLSYKHVPHR